MPTPGAQRAAPPRRRPRAPRRRTFHPSANPRAPQRAAGAMGGDGGAPLSRSPSRAHVLTCSTRSRRCLSMGIDARRVELRNVRSTAHHGVARDVDATDMCTRNPRGVRRSWLGTRGPSIHDRRRIFFRARSRDGTLERGTRRRPPPSPPSPYARQWALRQDPLHAAQSPAPVEKRRATGGVKCTTNPEAAWPRQNMRC
jgi:hypothetical protein